MTTEERVKQAIRILREAGPGPEFNLYLLGLKPEDPLAFSMVEIFVHNARNQYPLAVRKGVRLLPRVSGETWLAYRLFRSISIAYVGMGEMEAGESYLVRALETARQIGDRESVSRMRLQIYIARFFKAEYEIARRELLIYRKDPEAQEPHRADFFIGIYALIRGQPAEAIKTFDSCLETVEKGLLWLSTLEMKGLALRITGKLSDAMEALVESATGFISYDSAYSAFPVAKALELSRLSGLEPPPVDLIRKAISLAKKGSWGEQAAVEELEALLKDDDSDAAQGLYESAQNYLRAYQNIEALFSGLTAAYLAWKTDSPVFTKALKLIAPLVPLHPGFKRDPLLGDFMSEIEPLLMRALKSGQDNKGIKAYLIGELRVLVDGKEMKLTGWRRDKAIKAFVYLLLWPKHRIPADHLFYLLWPRRAYNKKNRWGLYKAVDTIRKNLGRRELLTHTRDYYQLEDTWTDLEELEDLARRADATVEPAEKEELLSRAQGLAKGELLPEFPYDSYIDEHRQYYERLRKRVFGE